uniref:Peptidase_M14 domain-containing protein n=1 Tax=Dracunculus medinensis TaxID=318479 RepID=A0A0N4UGX2_DRAME
LQYKSTRVGHLNMKYDHLLFESRFECGNLRKAIQVAPLYYQLVLSPDINQTTAHYQWFYFEVSNNQANLSYTFEIINCHKTGSMFSLGMQPVLFSVADNCENGTGWVRAGTSICYYRNLYCNNSLSPVKKEKQLKRFYSVRFNLIFRHQADVSYIVFVYISHLFLIYIVNKFCLNFSLIYKFFGSKIVHPGECNSSWIMHGILLKPKAVKLRENFIFKLIPMLNPDGVIQGNHRCNLAGVDLNRVWDHPNKQLHPTIYHAKGIIQFMVEILNKRPFIFVDLHGHSRQSSVFLYGNNPAESWYSGDRATEGKQEFIFLPKILDKTSKGFCLSNCRFNITKSKESSARVTVWRQFGVTRSYTMESSYCGFESGCYAGLQIGITELKEIGRDLCESLLCLRKIINE